jgi:hypothetical protein
MPAIRRIDWWPGGAGPAERGYSARPLLGPGDVMNCPVPLARKIVLQVAARDIGQLTDICDSSGASDLLAARQAVEAFRAPLS